MHFLGCYYDASGLSFKRVTQGMDKHNEIFGPNYNDYANLCITISSCLHICSILKTITIVHDKKEHQLWNCYELLYLWLLWVFYNEVNIVTDTLIELMCGTQEGLTMLFHQCITWSFHFCCKKLLQNCKKHLLNVSCPKKTLYIFK